MLLTIHSRSYLTFDNFKHKQYIPLVSGTYFNRNKLSTAIFKKLLNRYLWISHSASKATGHMGSWWELCGGATAKDQECLHQVCIWPFVVEQSVSACFSHGYECMNEQITEVRAHTHTKTTWFYMLLPAQKMQGVMNALKSITCPLLQCGNFRFFRLCTHTQRWNAYTATEPLQNSTMKRLWLKTGT